MNIGTHASHCCKWHGCKYGDENCPVVTGEVEQEYPCEYCDEEIADADYHTAVVARLPHIMELKIKCIKRRYRAEIEELRNERT